MQARFQRWWRFRFDLKAILLITLCVGVALATVRITESAFAGLFAVVALCAVIGLVQQILDLTRAAAGEPFARVADRRALYFAIAWRCMLVVFLELSFFGHNSEEFNKQMQLGLFDSIVEFAFYLLLLLALQTRPTAPPRPTKSPVAIAGFIACMALLAVVVWDAAMPETFLVHLAITGIELATPLHLADQSFASAATQSQYNSNVVRFLVMTSAGVICWSTAVLLLLLLVRRMQQYRRRQRIVLVVCWLIGIAGAASVVVWLCRGGVSTVSRHLGQNLLELYSPSVYVFAAAILLSAVTAITYYLLRIADNRGVVWSERRKYLNEHWAVAFLVTVPFLMTIGSLLRSLFFSPLLTIGEIIAGIFISPTYSMMFALAAVCVRSVYRSFRSRRAVTVPRLLVPVDAKFVLLWLGLLICLLLAAPLFIWFSFASWIALDVL